MPDPTPTPPERLTFEDVMRLHEALAAASGGAVGLADRGILESALAQPFAAFGGAELYPTLPEKAACLCYSIVRGHPFLDGNKRAGYAAADVFLRLNGLRLAADVDDAEATILDLAAGELSRDALTAWVTEHAVPRG